jgi:hypothetical protein
MVAVTGNIFSYAATMQSFLHSQKALDVYRDVLYTPRLILSRISEMKYILPSSILQYLYQTKPSTTYEVVRKRSLNLYLQL